MSGGFKITTFLVLFFFVSCQKKISAIQDSSQSTDQASTTINLRVLGTSSLSGPDSLGSLLQSRLLAVCANCVLKVEDSGDTANLLGRLRKLKNQNSLDQFSAVMGLDSLDYLQAQREKIIPQGVVYDRGPFALLVDTQKFPRARWPKKWSDLTSHLKNQIVVQDPRTSSVGLGWLRAVNEYGLISLAQEKLLRKRVFPSWSASYSAFLKGEGVAIWTYLTSEAYHRCKESSSRYLALPLEEGYPEQEEYFVPLVENKSAIVSEKILLLKNILLSRDVQSLVAQTNWMLPSLANTPLPECFSSLTKIILAKPITLPPDSNTLMSWIDQWAL